MTYFPPYKKTSLYLDIDTVQATDSVNPKSLGNTNKMNHQKIIDEIREYCDEWIDVMDSVSASVGSEDIHAKQRREIYEKVLSIIKRNEGNEDD